MSEPLKRTLYRTLTLNLDPGTEAPTRRPSYQRFESRGPRNSLESQVAQNGRTLYPKVAHHGLKVAYKL